MSIKLQKDKTQLENNLEAIDQPLSLLTNKIVSSVADLNTAFSALWNLSDPEIEEIANYLGPVRVQETFEAHYITGTALNTILSLRGVDSPRAVVVKPRDLVIGEDGIITLVPLPVPVVEEPFVEPEVVVEPEIPTDPIVDPPADVPTEPEVPVDPPVDPEIPV